MRSLSTMRLVMIIHTGTVASSSAAVPAGIFCSAQAAPPVPAAGSAMPRMALARHSRRVGARQPASGCR